MDINVLLKRAYLHDGYSQLISNENPRKFENEMVILDSIDALSDKLRSPLVLWMKGYTQEQIAEKLGTSRTTVGDAIRKAQKVLKVELAEALQ